MDKIKYVDYDMWTDIQTPLKDSQHSSHREFIRSLIEKYEKKPSPYYPIVADAWERFTNGR